jgi:hypothetical protein
MSRRDGPIDRDYEDYLTSLANTQSGTEKLARFILAYKDASRAPGAVGQALGFGVRTFTGWGTKAETAAFNYLRDISQKPPVSGAQQTFWREIYTANLDTPTKVHPRLKWVERLMKAEQGPGPDSPQGSPSATPRGRPS